jgi:methylenetetrahydrofolate dehydrogenase (NADP+) / methenyltetrahydrofolate cyclohydrolase
MKILNGAELASYIKPRQAKQVRALRQSEAIEPRLAIVVTKDDPVIDTYVRLKQQYGEDILVDVEVCRVTQDEVLEKINQLNTRQDIHGIIVQLPLANPEDTDNVVNAVAAEKDVDGLGKNALFDPATPQAINWLLVGYNKELKDKKIVIVGHGRLVGEPLYAMWSKLGYDVTVVGREDDLQAELRGADVIVAATGQPELIKSEMIPIDAVVVDAGVASEGGKTVGDLDESVYDRDDLTITPRLGGVGPLTVAALFDNVIRSTRL